MRSIGDEESRGISRRDSGTVAAGSGSASPQPREGGTFDQVDQVGLDVFPGDHAGIRGHAVLRQLGRESSTNDEVEVDRPGAAVLGTQVPSPVRKQELDVTNG